MNKINELSNLSSLSHIDVIGVTEIWLHGELKDHEASLLGYVLYRLCRRSGKRGGRVALYLKSDVLQRMPPLLPSLSSLFEIALLVNSLASLRKQF